MKRTWLMMGFGAGMMYLFDPERGRRRRALLRDKFIHGTHEAVSGMSVTRRDAANRMRGFAAKLHSRFGTEYMTDEQLAQRVRSRIGRLVSHPRSINVTVDAGTVTLSGPVLEHEVPRLLRRVTRLGGVRAVANRLSPYPEPGNISGLQGEPCGPEHEFEYLQDNWSPAARMAAGVLGAAMGAFGAARRGVGGTATAMAGLGLMARSATNKSFRRLVGVGAGPYAIVYRKTMNFDAPIERVFDAWSHFEHFPEFMTNVQDVQQVDVDRWHWIIAGPLGASVEWDAVTSASIPNELLAWETVPGSPVQHTGNVRFQKNGEDKTRIHITLAYNPIAGVAGNIMATLFGANPKRGINEDLMRMKSFIETGKHPHDAARKPAEKPYSIH